MTYQDTSRDAFEGSARGLNERKVLVLVRCSPDGMTCDEFMNRTGMQHQSASPAFTALTRRGLLLRTDRRRKTRSGQKAAVYVAVDPGTLFSCPKRAKADVYRAAVRAAIKGRTTGDWMDFDSAIAELPDAERRRISQ
jgi:hypothetical protein